MTAPTKRPQTAAESAERDARPLGDEAGKSQQDIAKELGVSQARVCQLLKRARAAKAGKEGGEGA